MLCLFSACQKEMEAVPNPQPRVDTPHPTVGFTKYTISKGGHYCDQSNYAPLELSELRFRVRFDSSAVYQTATAENQWDINKLYGFSDNGSDHHQFSARFGWNWSEGALRLHAYVYNHGVRESKELCAVPIGKDVECSIQVVPGAYLFTVGGASTAMPRQSGAPRAKGYKLYPYFGGDEPAPHDIRIWIETR
jgi:hypothetical protein